MFDYLPPYRRGQSVVGYVSYCSSGRRLREAVPNISDRNNICREFALHARNYLRQPA